MSGLSIDRIRAVKVAAAAGPDDIVVVLLPDSGRGYLSKVFNAEWLGRRSIPGLSLGTHLVLEGMLREGRLHGVRTITNPKFEFA